MGNSKNITFKNTQGEELKGKLELPIDRKPHNFAVFAHCFTCSKNLNAAVNITRELAQAGYGVLRFDFTGLGESEGDFADTNFSGNVEDLIEAAHFLEKNYQAPSLLVGHSLGGAAVIFAADKLPSVKAVATIGSPSDPTHVKKLLQDSEEEILRNGKATVNLEGREFTIKKQFIDDLSNQSLQTVVKNFGKALLVMHSPQDLTVEVKNAEDIYVSAHHPKSFVSLDEANHLLSNSEDSRYVGKVIAQWASRYVDLPKEQKLRSKFQAAASLNPEEGYTTQMKMGNHFLTADEPIDVGGSDYGPNPYDLLTGALAACKAMTVRMYAQRKGWALENVTVHVNHQKDYHIDCKECETDSAAKIDAFICEVSFKGDLTAEQKERMLQIADRCPVHRTLSSEILIKSQMR